MKVLLTLTTLLFSFCLQLSFSQSDFRKGYIVTLSNDTILGEIRYGENHKDHLFCQFRNDLGVKIYYPIEIKGYGYKNDKSFTSQIISNNFVEILAEGELSLYKLEDDFYFKKGDELLKLEPSIGKFNVTLPIVLWKSQLSEWVSDCRNIKNDLESLEPKASDLKRFTNKYNSCKSLSMRSKKTIKPWSIVKLGFSSGISLSTITNNKIEESFYTSIPDSYLGFSYSFGLLFGISPPGVSERLFLNAEINYVKSGFSQTIELFEQQARTINKSEVELSYIQVPIYYNYRLWNSRYPLCLHLGLFFTNSINVYSNLNTTTYVENNLQSIENEVIYPHTYKFTLGPLGGVSVQKEFSKFKGEALLRYQWNDFIKYPHFYSSQSRYLYAHNSSITLAIIITYVL